MIDKIIRYEAGELPEAETAELFQHLLDTGVIYSLQGHYQRTLEDLIGQGLVTRQIVKKARRRAAKKILKNRLSFARRSR